MRRWKMMQLINADFLLTVKNVSEISDKYINGAGQEQPYKGWSISKFHEITPNCKRLFFGKNVIEYGAFYDANKQLISVITKNKLKAHDDIPILQFIEIPEQAKYFRDSDASSYINQKVFILTN